MPRGPVPGFGPAVAEPCVTEYSFFSHHGISQSQPLFASTWQRIMVTGVNKKTMFENNKQLPELIVKFHFCQFYSHDWLTRIL